MELRQLLRQLDAIVFRRLDRAGRDSGSCNNRCRQSLSARQSGQCAGKKCIAGAAGINDFHWQSRLKSTFATDYIIIYATARPQRNHQRL